MLWYKKFDYNMKDDLKVMCNEYTEQFDHEPFWTYKSVANSKMWIIPPLGEKENDCLMLLIMQYYKTFVVLKNQSQKQLD